jgi:predicted ATP-dependent endonuclease of OLD family
VETQIQPLYIIYKTSANLGYIKKKNETEFYPLHFGASGYQATIPIVLSVKHYSEIEKKSKTFIVEEPELNLFPKTQKNLVEFFVEKINLNRHSFLIPTHSPYLLSVANDLLMAYKKGQSNKYEVSEIIEEKYWLNPNEFSAYELSKGESKSIFDKKVGLIGDNMIDEASDEMNDEFDNLLDI